jgi:hypothetical protein
MSFFYRITNNVWFEETKSYKDIVVTFPVDYSLDTFNAKAIREVIEPILVEGARRTGAKVELVEKAQSEKATRL